MNRSGRFLAALLAGPCFGACSINPLTKRPDMVITSKAKESEIGKQEAAKVEATMGLMQDPELTAYVAAIGERLAHQVPDSEFEFTFNIVSMDQPNAFALPGGPVYVSRGLIPLTNSEDELANVIGHEVAHVLGRHAASRVTLSAPISIVTGIGAFATGIVSSRLSNLVSGIGGVTNSLIFSPYSREQENQADRYGMELAAKSGWDPAAMSKFLSVLQNQEKLVGAEQSKFSFFSSHPNTPDRVEKTVSRARSIEIVPDAPIEPTRRAFLDKLDGIIVDQDPEEGIFIDNHMLHTGMGFGIEYPEDWKTVNQPQAIAAAEPDGRALSVLQLAGEGNNPLAAARKIAPNYGLSDRNLREIDINGLPAVRTRARSKKTMLDLTWVALGGKIFQISCATSPDSEEEFRQLFIKIPHSFHALSREEIDSIAVRRLRIREARSMETVAELAKRTGSHWKPAEVAVANGLELDARLQTGMPVKIVLEEPYERSGRED
jgi:predicted Zn-dependent protease